MSENRAPEKIQKVLARAGAGSRREIERLIEQGQVMVNGKPAELGMRIIGNERIKVAGKPVDRRAMQPYKARVIILNKPEGCICSRHDPEGRKTVFEFLPAIARGRWIVVGRLDFNTSGLLLFTDDGELANALMHPSNQIDREYSVRVMGELNPAIQRKMTEGVVLEDGPASFEHLIDTGGTGLNHWYNVVLKEGRNREVRRIFESQEIQVSRLIRVRYGSVELPRELRQGRYRYLESNDVRQLYESVGLHFDEIVTPSKAIPKRRANQQDRQQRKPSSSNRRQSNRNKSPYKR